MTKGLIVKSLSGEYSVVDENNNIYICKPRGVFRYQDLSPKVGDKVIFDEEQKSIIKLEKRKNDLIRPVICNVDKVFLVFSVKEPDLNLNLLDRILAICSYNNIEVLIIFSKLDLLTNEEEKEEFLNIKKYYEKIGYKVFTNNLLNELKKEIKENICTVAGQSGVGKSSLLNLISDELNLKTNQISYSLGRGKHTTRHVELLRVADGWIADTPGFGIQEFDDFDMLTLSQSFKEFYEASSKCKYSKCCHINEPKCEVKRLVEEKIILNSRYDNYLLFSKEVMDKIKNKY